MLEFWTCGHEAEAVCGMCHQELIARANALAAENLALRERLDKSNKLLHGDGSNGGDDAV
jgi:hypothetical protein